MTQLFDSLYDQYKDTVYKYILVSLDFNHDLADDCMQDILELLLQKQEKVSSHPNPGGFFIVTARNFIKRYKTTRYNNNKKLVPLHDASPKLAYHVDFQEIINAMPDTDILKSTIIKKLNDTDINLYEMFYERGFSVTDIARRLSITEGNVKVRLFRLRIKVKQMVQDMFK